MTPLDPHDYEPNYRDDGDSRPVIVWGVGLAALAFVLGALAFVVVMAWPDDADAAPLNPPNSLQLGTANVVMQGQSQAIGCPQRGWTVRLANDVTINAAGIAHKEDTKATEIRPALQQCTHKDSFE